MVECVGGRTDLKSALSEVLPQIGYKGKVDDFVRYWFERDSNVQPKVIALAAGLRAQDVRTFVATGQEHYRASYLWRWCPDEWCSSRLMAVLSGKGRRGYQRATAGRLICGSSLIDAIVSSVIYLAR
jgi:hypothetical protein